MALNSQNALPSIQTPNDSSQPVSDVAVSILTSGTTTDPGYAANGDIFELCKLYPNNVVLTGHVEHVGSLGASATATLGIADDDGLGSNFVALTAASTAGAASRVSQTIPTPAKSTARKILAVRINGAAISAATRLNVLARVADARDIGFA